MSSSTTRARCSLTGAAATLEPRGRTTPAGSLRSPMVELLGRGGVRECPTMAPSRASPAGRPAAAPSRACSGHPPVTGRDPTWMVPSSAVRCSPPPAGGTADARPAPQAAATPAGCRRRGRPGRGRTTAGSRPRSAPGHRTRTRRSPLAGRAAAAGELPVDLLHGQQVGSQGPDPGHDGVQAGVVGLFPPGADDVPCGNPRPWHRGSMAERVPPASSKANDGDRAEFVGTNPSG